MIYPNERRLSKSSRRPAWMKKEIPKKLRHKKEAYKS